MTEQTASHSAQFGLTPQSKPTQHAGSGPGTGIEGTTGVSGYVNSDTGTRKPSTNGAQSSQDMPGTGQSILKPSQGSNKVGDESGGLLNKLNPLKKD